MEVSAKILSDITTFTKYAKFVPYLNRRENWEDISMRNMDMHINKYPALKDEIKQVYKDFVLTNKVLPSMRSMQFGGRPIELSANRMFNCAFLNADHPAVFWETMFCLLGGSGIGFSVQKQHVAKLPSVKGPTVKTRRFLVGDSIEGWADAVKVLVRAYFEGKSDPVFDFRDIRKKGARLVTSGGKAPGPDPLRICLDQLRAILNNAVGRNLGTLEVHDMQCHIADAVLSGGIRRAALISLFSKDDMDMLSCKSGMWWELNPQRGRANNSVVLERNTTTEEEFNNIWKLVEASGAGEPGFYWTNDTDSGTNPCCFVGDTQVTTTDGTMSIKELVEQVTQGKQITIPTYNTNFGVIENKVIVTGMLSKKNASVITVVFNKSTGEETSVTCTPDHRFFTANRGWIEAVNLTQSDAIIESTLGTSTVQEINHNVENSDVYDIEVEDNHNFFVNGLLAHNCEIFLRSMQFCNLTETNADGIDSQEELNKRVKAATLIGTLQAGYTDFHYLRPEWKENTEREALIGVGITGIGSGCLEDLNMNEAAACVIAENARVAALIGINVAARTTCVKPSGTSSLRVGSSSGIHAWHNDYYIRRMRVGKNEALYTYMIENFPTLVEDCKFKPHLEAVMSFPQKAPEKAILRTEPVMHLLERVKRFNQEWVAPGHRTGENHHNVSCTISVKPDEWFVVGDWMWKNRETYTGISVLPYDNGTYVQAPFEDCTQETYESMLPFLHDINLDDVKEIDDNTNLTENIACSGGACEVTF